MKYLEDVKAASEFKINNVPLTTDDYDNVVLEKMRDEVIQNEIHRLLNEYSTKIVKSAKTLEEIAFCRGALDGLKALLDLKDGRKERVTIT